MVGGEDLQHRPVRGAAAHDAEVGANGGFWHVSADVSAGVAADADLGGVVIAPESGVLAAERTVTVIHIIGLTRDREVHSPAVAGTVVRGVG